MEAYVHEGGWIWRGRTYHRGDTVDAPERQIEAWAEDGLVGSQPPEDEPAEVEAEAEPAEAGEEAEGEPGETGGSVFEESVAALLDSTVSGLPEALEEVQHPAVVRAALEKDERVTAAEHYEKRLEELEGE